MLPTSFFDALSGKSTGWRNYGLPFAQKPLTGPPAPGSAMNMLQRSEAPMPETSAPAPWQVPTSDATTPTTRTQVQPRLAMEGDEVPNSPKAQEASVQVRLSFSVYGPS
jgi:hypothetical protein